MKAVEVQTANCKLQTANCAEAESRVVRVKVTMEHILRGKPRKPLCCPVSLAVQEALGRRCVIVDTHAIMIGREWAPMPAAVDEWVGRFDQARPLMPFEFKIVQTGERFAVVELGAPRPNAVDLVEWVDGVGAVRSTGMEVGV